MRFILPLLLAIIISGCGPSATQADNAADNIKLACEAVDSLGKDWQRQSMLQQQIVKKDPNALQHITSTGQECHFEENYRLSSYNDTALYHLIDRANSLFIKKSIDAGSARLFINKLSDKRTRDSLTALVNKSDGICVLPIQTDTSATLVPLQ